jgi:hypothetical protein
MAMQVRKGEKEILSQVLQSLEEYIERASQQKPDPSPSIKRNMHDDKRGGRKRTKT